MTSSSYHWFVQTDFGALLGPMPSEALAEMARTGALLMRDQVRQGTDGDWRLASEVGGLFDPQAPSLDLSSLENLIAPHATAPRDTTSASQVELATPPIADAARDSNESQQLEFEVDAPLVTPPGRVKPVNVAITPPAAPIDQSDAEPTAEPVSAWKAPIPPPRWRPPTATSLSKPRRRISGWLTGTIGTAVLLIAVSVWWFWPRQRTDIYANYVAIYKELRQRNESAGDQAGWSEFVSRAKSQLDDSLPWLEDRAKPGDREKSLLLYAGHDLREWLDLPSNSKSPHAKRLSSFFEQLREMYGAE